MTVPGNHGWQASTNISITAIHSSLEMKIKQPVSSGGKEDSVTKNRPDHDCQLTTLYNTTQTAFSRGPQFSEKSE